jgi:hypothetical protein
MPSDPVCFSCRAPLAAANAGNPYAPGPGGKPPLASRIGAVCGLLGACGAQIALMAFFPDLPEDNAWLYRAVAAGVGAGVFGGLGFALVSMFTRGASQPATPFDQPLRR